MIQSNAYGALAAVLNAASICLNIEVKRPTQQRIVSAQATWAPNVAGAVASQAASGYTRVTVYRGAASQQDTMPPNGDPVRQLGGQVRIIWDGFVPFQGLSPLPDFSKWPDELARVEANEVVGMLMIRPQDPIVGAAFDALGSIMLVGADVVDNADADIRKYKVK